MNRVLHLYPYEKFTYDYIKKIYESFDKELHTFYVYWVKDDNNIKDLQKLSDDMKGEIIVEKDINLYKSIKLLLKTKRYDKIIFHSLILPFPVLFLFSFFGKFISYKFIWAIWGVDLYNAYAERNLSIKNRIREFFRVKLIKNIKLVSAINSDVKYLKKIYNVEPKCITALYTYNFMNVNEKNTKHNNLNILIGNSATETCQHIDAIDVISNNFDCENKVYCTLSYPKTSVEYINKVINYGKEKIGDSFIPMVDFMKYDDYIEWLSDIDVAIFNHNRQQALGNIVALLYLEKIVFINEENGCYEFLKNLGIDVYSMKEFDYGLIKNLKNHNFDRNRKIIQDFFSDESFVSNWRNVFEYEVKEIKND